VACTTTARVRSRTPGVTGAHSSVSPLTVQRAREERSESRVCLRIAEAVFEAGTTANIGFAIVAAAPLTDPA
jgi:hypothetical protein